MIVWEPGQRDSEGEPILGGFTTDYVPEIHVFDNDDRAAQKKFQYCPCSLGACLDGWCLVDARADIFGAFLAAVEDGVPVQDVHREFLKIDVYRGLCKHRDFFDIETPEEVEA